MKITSDVGERKLRGVRSLATGLVVCSYLLRVFSGASRHYNVKRFGRGSSVQCSQQLPDTVLSISGAEICSFFSFSSITPMFYSNGGSLSSVDTSLRAPFLHNVLLRSIIDSFRKFLNVLGRFEELVAFSLISSLLIWLGKAVV